MDDNSEGADVTNADPESVDNTAKEPRLIALSKIETGDASTNKLESRESKIAQGTGADNGRSWAEKNPWIWSEAHQDYYYATLGNDGKPRSLAYIMVRAY